MPAIGSTSTATGNTSRAWPPRSSSERPTCRRNLTRRRSAKSSTLSSPGAGRDHRLAMLRRACRRAAEVLRHLRRTRHRQDLHAGADPGVAAGAGTQPKAPHCRGRAYRQSRRPHPGLDPHCQSHPRLRRGHAGATARARHDHSPVARLPPRLRPLPPRRRQSLAL